MKNVRTKKKVEAEKKDAHLEIMNHLQELKKITKAQQKRLDILHKEVHKINTRTHMFVVMGYVKVALVVLPVIWGFVYLPAFFQKIYFKYQPIFQGIIDVSQVEKSGNSFSRSELERIIHTLPR